MEKPTPNFVQSSLINPYKSKDRYPKKAKGMSFFAFVLSIFIYISIFYIFNLSPSKLFKNFKFWFFICNTIIIIILVDYGAFSSSKDNNKQLDLYQDYIMRRQRSAPSSYRQYYSQIIKTHIPEEEVEDLQEKRKVTHQRTRVPAETRLSIVRERSSTSFQGTNKKKLESCLKQENVNGGLEKKKLIQAKTLLQRSKSDATKRVVIDESKNIIRRVETERYDSPPDPLDEEENNKNDYANMSNEELNRRVEEFIQRFNRQIRLQRDVY
ncbi:hypothetical protein P3X46_032974 [Hevea brasiliensis]|uniref:DUF4408 domain-containing protein n=1 Tax=Hevea brasiliensis TaxID=3981 RepID=A0ABQ9KGV2_HEVBR|nr:uncharacterized protein LOC110646571 [Hevea brasiliensis]KAJ9135846.1 hypothetical protein P3X46_032974 [Hevea brasiliensis]